MLPDEASAMLEKTGKTPPHEERNAGENLWFIDFAAPRTDTRLVIRRLREIPFFKGKTGRSFRRDLQSNVLSIRYRRSP